MTPTPRRSLSQLDPAAFVSVAKVAAHYDVSAELVLADVRRGELKCKRIGRKRIVRIRVKDALAWGEIR